MGEGYTNAGMEMGSPTTNYFFSMYEVVLGGNKRQSEEDVYERNTLHTVLIYPYYQLLCRSNSFVTTGITCTVSYTEYVCTVPYTQLATLDVALPL